MGLPQCRQPFPFRLARSKATAPTPTPSALKKLLPGRSDLSTTTGIGEGDELDEDDEAEEFESVEESELREPEAEEKEDDELSLVFVSPDRARLEPLDGTKS
jgi:hypothetical protein